VNVSQA